MCDPVSIAVGITTTLVSTATSVASAASAAQRQANAQAEANQRMAEQAAAEATAKNIQSNVAAQQRAAALTRENLDISLEAARTSGANVTEFTAAGVEGNFVSDVSDALAFEESQAIGAATVQKMFADQAASLSDANNAQGHAQTIANLQEGEIDYGSDVISGVIGGISTGISVGGAVNNSDIFKPKSGANSTSNLTIE